MNWQRQEQNQDPALHYINYTHIYITANHTIFILQLVSGSCSNLICFKTIPFSIALCGKVNFLTFYKQLDFWDLSLCPFVTQLSNIKNSPLSISS